MSVDGMGSSDVYGRKRVGVGISDVSRRRRSMDVLSYRTVREGTGRFQGAGDERGCCRLVWTGCDGDEWSRYAP